MPRIGNMITARQMDFIGKTDADGMLQQYPPSGTSISPHQGLHHQEPTPPIRQCSRSHHRYFGSLKSWIQEALYEIC